MSFSDETVIENESRLQSQNRKERGLGAHANGVTGGELSGIVFSLAEASEDETLLASLTDHFPRCIGCYPPGKLPS